MIESFLPEILFYVFAVLTVCAALVVVFARNPVYAVLALVAAFVTSAVLWLLLQAEFLALVLVFLYVGAVMTLFLFVVMMLNIDQAPKQEGFIRYMPVGILMFFSLLGLFIYAFLPMNYSAANTTFHFSGIGSDNLKVIANLLFTKYVYAFEVTGALLLVAIISTISLVFNERRKSSKSQDIARQIDATKRDRLRVVQVKRGDKQ